MCAVGDTILRSGLALDDVDKVRVVVLSVLEGVVIVVPVVGELSDDVPGVDEARQESEAAEENIDNRVGAADTTLHPY